MTVDAAEFGQSKATFAGRKKGMTVAKRKLDFDDSDDDVPVIKKAIPPKRITAPAIVNQKAIVDLVDKKEKAETIVETSEASSKPKKKTVFEDSSENEKSDKSDW